VPRKASEVGACKDLEGHIFTIDAGNRGKDGDMLHTSMEKMATYVGTKYVDEAPRNGPAERRLLSPSQYLVWYSKKAITNIICLKNLIKYY
jgi:hypothetical protein